MDDHFGQCRQLVRYADRDRYLATLYAPEIHRDALFAVYAFQSDLASIRDRAHEPMPGEIRLQWWREVLQGQRDGEAAAHPVAAALRQTISRYSLDIAPLLALIDAHGFDLYDEPMKTIGNFEAYAAKTSTAILELAVHVLAGRRYADTGVIVNAGTAFALRNILTAFPQHSARRQVYVPTDILNHYGAKLEDAFSGKVTPEWRAALAELRLRARGHLDLTARSITSADPAIMPALLAAAVIRPTLNLMERKNYDPLHPPELAAWRRQWIIWRAARNPAAIFG